MGYKLSELKEFGGFIEIQKSLLWIFSENGRDFTTTTRQVSTVGQELEGLLFLQFSFESPDEVNWVSP